MSQAVATKSKDSVKDKYQAIEDKYRSKNKSVGQDYFVIDADRHIIEPPEAFTKYLDKEFAKQAPKLVTDNSGSPRLMIEGRLYQKPVGFGPGRPEGCGDQRPRGIGLTYEQAHQHAFENRDIDMDLSGIDMAIWIPTLGLFTPDIICKRTQYAIMRALNDWTAKDWATGKRHMWCATIPIVPKMAVEEIKRCKKMGATAVWMRPNVMQGAHWWNPDWDEVWQTMSDLDMPLVFHEATGTYNATYSTDYKFNRYWLAHVVSHPGEMSTGMCGIIGYGVLQRFPKLKVLFCEGGATWVPYYLFRLDSHYDGRKPEELIDLDMKPSEYFKRQCVICSFEPEEALMLETMQWLEGKNMGCTSDYPHWDSSGVSGVVRYLELYPEFSEETRKNFFSRNVLDALPLKA